MFQRNLLLPFSIPNGEPAGSSNPLVIMYETMLRHNTEDQNLNFHSHENYKSHTTNSVSNCSSYVNGTSQTYLAKSEHKGTQMYNSY
jgi:hypothetical protein